MISNDPAAFLHELFATAVRAAHPSAVMTGHFPEAPRGRLIVLGAGKAAAAMAQTAEQHYGSAVEGIVIAPEGYTVPCAKIEVVAASHPVPDARGAAAAQRILERAKDAKADDLVLCLISGGASALMALPAPGVSLEDKRAVTKALLRCGAAIEEINCVRKHLSAIKGGRLAAAAAPARVVSLIISDVVGDDPAVIASGPTVSDPTTCQDALAILDKYAVPIPATMRTLLVEGKLETPKGGLRETHKIIATPAQAIAVAAAKVRAAGFDVLDLGDRCAGEARLAAAEQARLIRSVIAGEGAVKAPCVILSGGEFVVTIKGDGVGGPNTEFALALALQLDGLADVWALAGDTDGRDGNAGVAGALVTPTTLQRARAAGLDAALALNRNDSAGIFGPLGDLVDPGPTMTNVNDFRALLVLPGVASRAY